MAEDDAPESAALQVVFGLIACTLLICDVLSFAYVLHSCQPTPSGRRTCSQEELPAAPAVPLGPFSLPVLKIITEAQSLHGLRYGDYQRYRSFSIDGRLLALLLDASGFV